MNLIYSRLCFSCTYSIIDNFFVKRTSTEPYLLCDYRSGFRIFLEEMNWISNWVLAALLSGICSAKDEARLSLMTNDVQDGVVIYTQIVRLPNKFLCSHHCSYNKTTVSMHLKTKYICVSVIAI